MVCGGYADDDRRGVNPEHVEKIARVLARLDVSMRPEDLDLPGFRLHPLTGDLAGYWSVTVRANWRIIFRFEDGNVTDVDLVDYHWSWRNGMAMKPPPHPGLSVRHDCIEPLGLTITRPPRSWASRGRRSIIW